MDETREEASPAPVGDRFDVHLQAWQEWATAPWGRLRFAVVGHVLQRHTEPLRARRDRPLRVLDVGGGDARDSLPLAARGHHVTVVDTSSGMLAEARRRATDAEVSLDLVRGSIDDLDTLLPGDFDLVLCHFVLQYRADPAADLDRLVAAAAPGGLVSVVAPNPVGRVLMRLTREGPAAALEELIRDDMVAATFGTTVRRVAAEDLRLAMLEHGLGIVGEYGGRMANDLLREDAPKHDPDYFNQLLELELSLCDREPYRRLGAFWQLIGQLPG